MVQISYKLKLLSEGHDFFYSHLAIKCDDTDSRHPMLKLTCEE